MVGKGRSERLGVSAAEPPRYPPVLLGQLAQRLQRVHEVVLRDGAAAVVNQERLLDTAGRLAPVGWTREHHMSQRT